MNLAGAVSEDQQVYGRDTQALVPIVSRLTAEGIAALAQGRVAALRRPRFIDGMMARRLANSILKHPGRKTYRAEPSLGFVGEALYDSNDDEAAREEYFRNRLANTELMRQLCAPYRSPLDAVRLEVEEAWKPGTRVETIDGRPLSVGIGRVFQPGSVAHEHQDVPHWDSHFHPDFAGVTATLSFVVYLMTADQGGQLVLYDRSLDRHDYDANRDPNVQYAIRRAALPQPSAVITPGVGELIVFKASAVHAVTRIASGIRVTLSMFGNVRTADLPIGWHS